MSGELTAAEIREQPAILARVLAQAGPEIAALADAVRVRHPRFVLFVARGTSDHAALYAKYLVETLLGLPAGLVSPSTMTVYGVRPNLRDVLFVGISQSGASPDLLDPMERARDSGAMTVAVTNAPTSPLARAAEHHLDILAGPERSVAATKSYTAQLLTLYLLLAGLAERIDPAINALPDQAETLITRDREVAGLATRYRFAEQILLTARGYNYPTVREGALKLMETSYLVSYGFSGADLLHGPMAMIDRGFPVIAVAPGGRGGESLVPVIERLHELGADTLLIGDPALCAPATLTFALTETGPEILSPILSIIPLQQLAYHLALERGVDPDQPRGLRKITETW
jgi:glucosamine--fructose-6-phosphate aminotransferase (isomerizing)